MIPVFPVETAPDQDRISVVYVGRAILTLLTALSWWWM